MRYAALPFLPALAVAFLQSNAVAYDDCPFLCPAGPPISRGSGTIVGVEVAWVSNGATDGTRTDGGPPCENLTCTNCTKNYAVTITVSQGISITYSADVDGSVVSGGTIHAGPNGPTKVDFSAMLDAKCNKTSTATVTIGTYTSTRGMNCGC